MVYWLFLLVTNIALASPVDQTKPFLSQKAYELWSNQKCQEVTQTELRQLQSAVQCGKTDNKNINKTKSDFNLISENIFFNYAAEKQSEILKCQISKLNHLTDNNQDAQKFRNLIQKDISTKLTDLRNLHKKIQEIQQQQKVLDVKLTRVNTVTPQQIDQLIQDKKKNEKQLAELIPHYSAIYSSIWSSSDPTMAEYLDSLISSDLSEKDFEKKYPFNDKVLKKMLAVSQGDLWRLKKQYNSKNKAYTLNQETKELLVKRGDTLVHLRDLEKDPQAFTGLACRLEARYGKGTEYFENGLVMGSLLLGGVGIIADLAAVGKLTQLGIALNARQAHVALSTANVLLASSTALSTMDTIQMLDKCAPQNSGSLSSFKTDNCTATAAQLTDFESERLTQTNCVLEVALAALPLGVNYGFKLGAKKYLHSERRLSESAKEKITATTRSEARSSFVDTHLTKTYATPEENLQWIKMAEQSSRGQKKDVRFVDIENSVMKSLNDTMKDKNFVTSLTNKNKEIIFKKVEELQKRNPGLEVNKYSDFKSARFAFSGKIPSDLDDQLKIMFQEANVEYSDFLKAENLVRANDSSENWFRAGLGETADEATLAARYSRKAAGNNRLQVFSDAEVKSSLKSAMNDAESLRAEIQKDFSQAEFMQKIPGTNKLILQETAFDVVRKSSTPEGAAEALEKIYGTKVSSAQAQKMKDYIKSIDEFSPGIHVAKREFANLTGAEKGGLSADFAGMGAANLSGTAKALAQVDELDKAILFSRLEEKKVTKEFLTKKSDFEGKVNNYLVGKKKLAGTSVTCSGDDCVVISAKNLDSKTKSELVQRLSKNDNPSGMRIAFVGDHVTDGGTRNTLAAHGEAIEKILRKNLQGKIPQEKLQKVLFSVDVQASDLGQGKMKLLVGNSRTKISETEQRKIQDAFDKAVNDFNDVLKKDQVIGNYSTAEP